MGNCCGAQKAASKTHEVNRLSRNKSQREAAWASTGTVALRDSKLKALPQAALLVGPAAKVLDASNNQIIHLPESISQLTNLKRLSLAGNQLETLPAAVCRLAQLKVLVLDNNRLTVLHTDIGLLQHLEKLSVSTNALTSLPTSIKQLHRLRVLDVSSNWLSSLESAMGDCESLEELNVSNNRLQALPDSLQRLKKLKILNTECNQLQTVPPGILTGCHSLHTLLLHETPITAKVFEELPGYAEFEQRRRSKFDKKISGGALLTEGMVEGVDRP